MFFLLLFCKYLVKNEKKKEEKLLFSDSSIKKMFELKKFKNFLLLKVIAEKKSIDCKFLLK